MFVIFGASGKVGRVTVAALRSAGQPVRAIVRNPLQAESLAQLGCEIAVADLLDLESVKTALDGAFAVQILCPVPVDDSDPGKTMHRMIEIVAEALRAKPPSRVLALSDYGAELESGTGITLLFHALEMRLKEQLGAAVKNLTLLRSAEHMQNWARVMPVALATNTLPSLHHPLSKRFPSVAAQDVGQLAAELLLDKAHNTALDDAPHVVSIEGPQRLSALEMASVLSDLCGREISARELPRNEWTPTLLRAGMSERHAQLIADLYDTHNAGRIDVEDGISERRFGKTGVSTVLASLLALNASGPR